MKGFDRNVRCPYYSDLEGSIWTILAGFMPAILAHINRIIGIKVSIELPFAKFA